MTTMQEIRNGVPERVVQDIKTEWALKAISAVRSCANLDSACNFRCVRAEDSN